MMVATMFFLAVSVTIIFGLVGPVVRHQKVVSSLLFSRQSYFLAEAGLEDVVYRLSTGQSVGTTEILSLLGVTATTVTTDTAEGKKIVATGAAAETIRKVEANLILGEGVAFNYGIHVGSGGFVLGNNAGVVGNVYSNADVSASNGAYVTGSAIAVGTINNLDVGDDDSVGNAHASTVTNSTVEGTLHCKMGSGNNKPCDTSLANPVAQPFPITDEQIAEWKDEATLGGTFVGNKVISGAGNTLGPLKIQGNLTLNNGATLVVNGILWVTGNITLNNNSQMKLSPSYGTADGIIVTDGQTSLLNGSVLDGSGTEGSYIMLLSTNTSGNAVFFSNNAGAVILYVPDGTVQMNNRAYVEQITAKTLSIANKAIIEYGEGIIDANFISGPGGGYSVLTWKEVE